MSTPREKSSSLTQAQKTTLVRLITEHNEVLDKGTDYKSIIKRKHAWEEVAQAFNAAHPSPEPRTPTQLKRAWEYLKNRLKSDLHAKHKQIEEGNPPSPSEYDPLMESVLSLVKNDLEAFLQAPAVGGSPSTTSTPREKSSSLNYAQKRTLVDLITAHKTVLDKSADHKRILKKKRAWAELAEAYNAVHSSPDPKTPLQLKRAWEYLRSRVKSDFVSQAKQKQTGEGPPPSPPQHDPLVESVMSLIKDDLHYDDSQYDSSCQDAPEPPSSSPSYSCHSPCVILQEGNFELNYEEEDRYTEAHGEPAVTDDEPPEPPTTMPTRDDCDGSLPSAASGFERVRGKKRKREDNKEGAFNSVHENHNNIDKRKLELMEEKHIKEMSAIETFEKMCNTVNSFFTKLLENDSIFSQKHFYNSLIPNHPYKSPP